MNLYLIHLFLNPPSQPTQRAIDDCLAPSPKLEDKEDRDVSREEARWLAITAEEDEHERECEEEGLIESPLPVREEPEPMAAPVEEEEEEALDDEEAAFLDELEEQEKAEEDAFLAELDDDESSAPSPPPSSAPASPKSSVPSISQSQSPHRLHDYVMPQEIKQADSSGPRAQVIYEPHEAVAVNAVVWILLLNFR